MPKRWLIVACIIAAVGYLPILNNNFIGDDWVILERIEVLKAHPLYLYSVPPENFRLVSYFIFGILKSLVGYHAWVFYAFNIGIHVLNVVLLSRLLGVLVQDEITVRLAVLFFAVFQAPQEAIMWLAAMNETTLFCFGLLTLLLWWHGRHVLATIMYTLALFSKESAIIVPVAVLLLQLYKDRTLFRRTFLLLLIPTAGFVALFFLTLSKNFMLTNRSYSFGFQAILVLAKSVHRLLWPWIYIILLLVWRKRRELPSWPALAGYLGLVCLMMTPYMFIAYQTSLPSRQLYLACAVLMPLFAVLLRPLHKTVLLKAFVTIFIAFNIGYLWLRKDGQFEERAAPTTQLINALRGHTPQRTVIVEFAYPYPEIARAATLALPGWKPELISVNEEPKDCGSCWHLRWNAHQQRYE